MSDMLSAVLPGELMKHALSEATKAACKFDAGDSTAGLQVLAALDPLIEALGSRSETATAVRVAVLCCNRVTDALDSNTTSKNYTYVEG